MSMELIADSLVVVCVFATFAFFFRRKRCVTAIAEYEASRKKLEKDIRLHSVHASSKGNLRTLAEEEHRKLADLRISETGGDPYDEGKHLRKIMLPHVDAMITEATSLECSLEGQRKQQRNATFGMILGIVLCFIFITIRSCQA